jgi:hypothetical protein
MRVDQAEAAECCSRDRLSLAVDEPDPATRRDLMRAAVEFALRSVTIGWEAPASKAQRLWELFDDPIAALVPSEVRLLIDELRREGSVELMTAEQAAAAAVEAVLELRDSGPPSTWSPPTRCRVGWSGLSRCVG